MMDKTASELKTSLYYLRAVIHIAEETVRTHQPHREEIPVPQDTSAKIVMPEKPKEPDHREDCLELLKMAFFAVFTVVCAAFFCQYNCLTLFGINVVSAAFLCETGMAVHVFWLVLKCHRLEAFDYQCNVYDYKRDTAVANWRIKAAKREYSQKMQEYDRRKKEADEAFLIQTENQRIIQELIEKLKRSEAETQKKLAEINVQTADPEHGVDTAKAEDRIREAGKLLEQLAGSNDRIGDAEELEKRFLAYCGIQN